MQPENDHADWDSPPWEPTERGDRLYGRGAADDKAGIAAHLGAVRIFGDDLPVNLVMFIEGEEEVGSDTLVELLEAHKDRLAADVIVIADSGNWDIGEPALTTSLRGLVRMDVEVRTLTHAVHSGMWGGLVPDAILTLSRLVATLSCDRHTWTSICSKSGSNRRVVSMTRSRSASPGLPGCSSKELVMISACHWASRAVVRPSARAMRIVVCSSSRPASRCARTRRSAATSASENATASSAGAGKPSARQIRDAKSGRTPAASIT